MTKPIPLSLSGNWPEGEGVSNNLSVPDITPSGVRGIEGVVLKPIIA